MKASLLFALLFLATNLFAQKRDSANMENNKIKTVHELTLSAAQNLTEYGLQLADERKLNLSIAVTDRSGMLLAFVRMDDAAIVTIEVAIKKAKTAAYLKAPSKIFEDFVNSGKPSMVTTPGILPLQGGVPIIYKGQAIGAVGVSGASGENDNEIAYLISGYFK